MSSPVSSQSESSLLLVVSVRMRTRRHDKEGRHDVPTRNFARTSLFRGLILLHVKVLTSIQGTAHLTGKELDFVLYLNFRHFVLGSKTSKSG